MIKPYQIQHLQLQAIFEPDSFLPQSGQSHYCIFWWENIPLGEFFLEWYEQWRAADLRIKILNAIEPALDNYISRLPRIQGNYKDAFLKNNKAAFFSIINEILQPFVESNTANNLSPATVIICTRNRTADLKRCLESLAAGTVQPAEVIVVDNDPQNGDTKKVAEKFGVKYVPEPRPGLSIARNTGLAAATQDLVLFTDDDVVLHKYWYLNAVAPFSNSSLMGMTGLVLAAEMESVGQRVFEKFWRFNQGYVQKKYNHSFITSNQKKGAPVWDIGAGANMAFRKKVFEEVGLFDEGLGAGAAGCSEDSELWFRMLLKKMVIVYEPRCIVYHYHRKTLQALRSQIYNYMRGAAVAALQQQQMHPASNYRSYFFRHLPQYYFQLLKKGFPRYRFRYATLYQEITGLLSGIWLYSKGTVKVNKENK